MKKETIKKRLEKNAEMLHKSYAEMLQNFKLALDKEEKYLYNRKKRHGERSKIYSELYNELMRIK